MCKLILEWIEDKHFHTYTIASQITKQSPVKIGRDRACDVVLNDPTKTVSGEHVGIYFDPAANNFYLVNLTRDRQPPKQPNPAVVDYKKIIEQEVPLQVGSKIQLGKVAILQVKAIEKKLKRMAKCSHTNQHILPLEYLHRTCPYDGYLVAEEVEI